MQSEIDHSRLVATVLLIGFVPLTACDLGSPGARKWEGHTASGSCEINTAQAPNSSPVDLCRDGQLVFGPEHIERQPGAPRTRTFTFQTDADAAACVRVISSSDETGAAVASGEVTIDGQAVIDPSEFNPGVRSVDSRLFLSAGDHALDVTVRSRPHTWLDVEVRVSPSGEDRRLAAQARLFELYNLLAVSARFSPAVSPGVTELSVSGRALSLPGDPSPVQTFITGWLFEVRDPASCAVIRHFGGESPIEEDGSFSATATWDGRNDTGELVADGTYAYRAHVALLRRVWTGDTVIDDAFTPFQAVEVDATPPVLFYTAPAAFVVTGDGQLTPWSVELFPGDVTVFVLEGRALDSSGVGAITLELNGLAQQVETTTQMRGTSFRAPVDLATAADDAGTPNDLVLRATDAVGNVTVARTGVFVWNEIHPRRLILRFDAQAGSTFRQNVLAELKASVRFVDLTHGYYLIDIGIEPAGTLEELADSLTARSGIAYAMTIGFERPAINLPPNDPFYGTTNGRWPYDNDGTGGFTQVARPCPGGQGDCSSGFTCGPGFDAQDRCLCDSDDFCPTDRPTCDPNRNCRIHAVTNADIGWANVAATLMAIADGPETVTIAVNDNFGLFQLDHPDLAANVFTEPLECCTAPPCQDLDGDGLPDCSAGELVPGRSCTSDAECVAGGSCILIPTHGRCIGPSVSTPCTDDVDCVGGNVCLTFPALGTCTDGCPGACGVDDDGDGFADAADLEVQSLRERLLSNGIDDDDDCPGDTNGDGRFCGVGDDGVDEADEIRLSAWDDDEDGLIDDPHGFDFTASVKGGELFGNSVPGRHRSRTYVGHHHPTMVAGMVGAVIDNGIQIAGVHPNVRLLALGANASVLTSAARYATSRGVEIMVMAYEMGSVPNNNQVALDARDALWRDAIDPETVYVAAAGNAARDHDTLADPVTNPGGQSLTPSGVNDPHLVLVGATRIDDKLWSGSDFGATRIDIAAPADIVRVLDYPDTGTSSSGTSFAAPITAAAAGVILSAFPATFRKRPLALIDHLLASAEPLPSLAGKVKSGGRVDLENALDPATFPLPTPWKQESSRLNDLLMLNTHDVDPFDADGDGTLDFVLEVFGGPFEDEEQPRLYRIDRAAIELFDETAARLPSVSGNYNKADQGDMNGDGCADLVLGGFFEADPTALPNIVLRGVRNRLLLQASVAGVCQGTWTEATFDSTPAITRDVDLLDYDRDGDLDILFTNANYPLEFGNVGNQLLENDGNGDFIDVSVRLPPQGNDPHKAGTASCDLDGDSFIDVVLAVNSSGQPNRVFFNRPDPADPSKRIFEDHTTTSGLPPSSGFSHDVECVDFNGDGRKDIVFARRRGTKNLLLTNNGDLTFTDASNLLPEVADGTQEVEVCDLDSDGKPEIFFGNGDIVEWRAEANRVLVQEPTGHYRDADLELGFDFASTIDLTEDIECLDLEGDGVVDAVFIGNTGARNFFYVRGE